MTLNGLKQSLATFFVCVKTPSPDPPPPPEPPGVIVGVVRLGIHNAV